ncbi:DUF7563 family protein [Halorarius halobius]|uniref:DUF7563 family protein n=1 Tax=Halorarius halobius TaxID=2962671 RepID=UPI0020CBB2C7|nr:hypothetical protein [Halorarius halobius]
MQYCETCGGPVTDDFVRVFGTDDGEVFACLDCATMREIAAGGAATGAETTAR